MKETPVRSVPTRRSGKQFGSQGATPPPKASRWHKKHLAIVLEPSSLQWHFARPLTLRQSCPQFVGISQGNIKKFFQNIVFKSLRSAQARPEQTLLGWGAGRPDWTCLVCRVFWTGAIYHKPLVYAPGRRRGGQQWDHTFNRKIIFSFYNIHSL